MFITRSYRNLSQPRTYAMAIRKNPIVTAMKVKSNIPISPQFGAGESNVNIVAKISKC